ncbi:DNA primase [Deinococcus roseus]|uniref:DNA primase n=1 Tax=Deinococcus roseus TaxID=392414 RepID=A0ABQ2D7S9_9DEIO|nr:DNA primase [Deinococcus roseus]GGJ48003.1 DNA primase [Deinococcus roseus]
MGVKDSIKAKLPLESVVAEHLQLLPAGPHRLKARCPFHREDTPSFVVDTQADYYYCFGCKASGDVFSFVQRSENLSFSEALQKLADRAGIKLEFASSKEKMSLLEVNQFALQYFQACLNQPAGAAALQYLHSRGLTSDSIQAFELGFAPSGWTALLEHAKAARIDEQLLLDAGLLAQKEHRTYDRFRNRVMFPIRDALGRVVGFGGRVLDDSKPKYLNTPETPLFSKKTVLYGLDRARGVALKDGLVLVEGYLDVIMMQQSGVHNAVATLGTALTAEHADVLSRLGIRRLKLMFDRDEAGIKATLAGLDQAIGRSFAVSAHQVPAGKDPAEFLLSGEVSELVNGLQHGISEVDFRVEVALSACDVKTPEGQRDFLQQLLPRMQPLSVLDFAALDMRRQVASVLGMPEQRLLEWLDHHAKGPNLESWQVTPGGQPSTEDLLVFHLWKHPTWREWCGEADGYQSVLLQQVLKGLQQHQDPQMLLDWLEQQGLKDVLLQVVFAEHEAMSEEAFQRFLSEYREKLGRVTLKAQLQVLRAELSTADPQRQRMLLSEIHMLQQKLQQVVHID